ncbi:MAG: hypothetical protein CMK46_04950 [Porticoccus sp.]|uniref:hypothetical protein n=1 Tax=Porticoccus hydrocarbonoclasticus TaxID=1073414 RepID=UPI000C63F14D|nr:hypothetical protein [Porticoccus hydrocarbonoclasticus]MBG57621.1 hypothetical protein [Porticoccus sp.]|tara:strand:+ start:2651 stop:2956 length:306 start_codon:yes stop_codon:yes gene_type:complete
MTIKLLKRLRKMRQLDTVRFIRNACAPMVLQVAFFDNGQLRKQLIRTREGGVVTCRHLGEAYELCRSAGVHRAELVQIVSHDEACAGDSSVATGPAMSLIF